MISTKTELEDDIERLITWLSKNYEIPPFNMIRVAIDSGETIEGISTFKIKINANDVFTIEDYSPTYLDFKRKGYSWINLHCAGIYNSDLYVVIEYPNQNTGVSSTSINLSGPNNIPEKNIPNWNFEDFYLLA